MRGKRFVILDRDGTIIEKHHYLLDPAHVALLPGAGEALYRMQHILGLGLVIITNQSPVGRGLLSIDTLSRIHERLKQLLGGFRVTIDGVFFCPHAPEAGCNCRKPRTGLVEAAARELHFDPAQCFLIGDSLSDMELGIAVSSTTFLVRTGSGRDVERAGGGRARYIVDDLSQAAERIECILPAMLENNQRSPDLRMGKGRT